MSNKGWIAPLVAGLCLGIAVGTATSSRKKPRPERRQQEPKTEPGENKSNRVRTPVSSLGKLARALAESQKRIAELEAELAEVKGQLPLPANPEEEERKKEEDEKRKRAERSEALFQKAKALRGEIVQRSDGRLREKRLEELSRLVESGDPDNLLLGLTTLFHLDGMDVGAERFKPQILTARQSESAEVRRAAANCLSSVWDKDEGIDLLLGMVRDSSPEIRGSVAFHLGSLAEKERAEEMEVVLTSLLKDEDEMVRRRALLALSEVYGFQESDERAKRTESLVSDMLSDPRKAEEVMGWWDRRTMFSPQDAQRLGQMLLDTDFELFRDGEGYSDRVLREIFQSPIIGDGEEPRAVVFQLCLKVLNGRYDDSLQLRALTVFRDSRDRDCVPVLEEVARSGAVGVPEALAETIGYLQAGGSLPSLSRRTRKETQASHEEEAAE
ncbi:MAG: HEAT repeat domain-containing protein [bacterium]|nr:HEAT repeat domain-containing protein [bacterium]